MIFIDGFSIQEPLQRRPRSSIKRSSLVKKGSSIVFVNGQVHFDESVSLQHAAFLNLFLRHGARGVIGTLGKLKAEVSEDVIESFFELLSQSKQQSSDAVPNILKRMREKAYKRLLENMEENRACYLATLLYIYYGDIQTNLHLSPNSS